MVESQARVQFLYGSSIFDLKLDFLHIRDISEVLSKVQELYPSSGVALRHLHFVYSDEVTPVTHLDIIEPEDLQFLQQHVQQSGCTDVFFQYDQTGRIESMRAALFFSKMRSELSPAFSKSMSMEETKVEVVTQAVEVQQAEIQPFIFQYSLALDKSPILKTSLKQRDFTIISDSSFLEPESVPVNTLFTRTWVLLVTGAPWERISVVCVRGRQVGAQLSVTKKGAEVKVEMQLQVIEAASLALRLELDGECCGPLLWAEVALQSESTVEERLIELGVSSYDIDRLKQLMEFGLTDLPKLVKTWNSTYRKDMETVAALYYGDED